METTRDILKMVVDIKRIYKIKIKTKGLSGAAARTGKLTKIGKKNYRKASIEVDRNSKINHNVGIIRE